MCKAMQSCAAERQLDGAGCTLYLCHRALLADETSDSHVDVQAEADTCRRKH